MRIAVYPTSANPPTYGHADILVRTSKLFDHVYWSAAMNSEKEYIFAEEGRVKMMNEYVKHYDLKNVTVESCGDKGISVGESSNVVIDNLLASNSKTGLASKDFAKIFVNKGLIKTTKKCIEAYNKKQEFSGGFIKVDNLYCKNSNKNLSIDDKSLFKGNIL